MKCRRLSVSLSGNRKIIMKNKLEIHCYSLNNSLYIDHYEMSNRSHIMTLLSNEIAAGRAMLLFLVNVTGQKACEQL